MNDGDNMADVMHAFRVKVTGRGNNDGERVNYSRVHWTADGYALFRRFRARYPRAVVNVTELPGMRWDD